MLHAKRVKNLTERVLKQMLMWLSHLVRLHQWYTIITGVQHPDEDKFLSMQP